MMAHVADQVQKSTASSKTTKDGTAPAAGSPGGGVRSQLRGMSYADGAAALAPVQKKDDHAAGAAKPSVATVSDAKMEKVTEDLGQVSSMGEANAVIGGALGLFAPRPGTAADAYLKVQVYGSGFYVELELKANVKHTKAGFEMGGSMGVGVGVGTVAAGMKAWAGLKGTVGFNAKADDASECMDLVGLGIFSWMSDQEITVYDAICSPTLAMLKATGGMAWLAEAIFGEGFDDKVLRKMDPASAGAGADTLTYSQELGVDAGVAASAGEGEAKAAGGVRGNVSGKQQTTLSKGADGKLQEKSETGISGAFRLDVAVGGFVAIGECKFWKPSHGEAEVELLLEIGLPGGDISTLAGQIWDTWGNAIAGGLKGIDDAKLRKEIHLSALAAPRAAVMAGLQSAHFVHPAIEFVFKLSGAHREFAVELVKHAVIDKKVGAGAGGTAVEGRVATKTELVHTHWSVGGGEGHH